MRIRPATREDFPAILSLWNRVISETVVTFSSEEKTADGLAAMIDKRRAAGQEFWVAAEGGLLLGFASYGQFRAGNGYAHAMEHTIILAETARGGGTGRALMDVLESHARSAGCNTMIAGVAAENAAAIGFHTALGYREVARISEVGRKFVRWHDLVMLQKLL